MDDQTSPVGTSVVRGAYDASVKLTFLGNVFNLDWSQEKGSPRHSAADLLSPWQNPSIMFKNIEQVIRQLEV
jgi:hypothetical protein